MTPLAHADALPIDHAVELLAAVALAFSAGAAWVRGWTR